MALAKVARSVVALVAMSRDTRTIKPADTWALALAVGFGLAAAGGCDLDDGVGGPEGDAGPGGAVDAEGDDELEPRCETSVDTSTVCLEAVEGRPGDTVEVEVHVLLDEPACSEFQEGFASVEYENAVFELASEEAETDCFELQDYEFSDGSRVVDWYITADDDEDSECPEGFAPGMKDTIEFAIRGDASEGDYTLPLDTASVGASDSECEGLGQISGLIRVLAPD